MSDETCSALSRAAGEALPGTAGRADVFLLLEVRGSWERDALDGLAGPSADAVRAWLAATPRSKALFIRRPDRRGGQLLAFMVRATSDPPTIQRFELARYGELGVVDLVAGGDAVAGPLALVCAHARRDACCARLGRPLYDALHDELGPESLWLSSHQGGHRFAPNLLWLPDGLLFGRVEPPEAATLVGDLRRGRLPVERLRGRTTLPPEAQAAEIAVRERSGIAGLSDVEFVSAENGRVRLALPSREVEAIVEVQTGPAVPASCGAAPEPVKRYVVTSIT